MAVVPYSLTVPVAAGAPPSNAVGVLRVADAIRYDQISDARGPHPPFGRRLDTFNRPDAPLGPPWTTRYVMPTIVDHACEGHDSLPVWPDVFSGDAVVFATIRRPGDEVNLDAGFDLNLHGTDMDVGGPTASSYDLAIYGGSGGRFLQRWDGESTVLLESYPDRQPEIGDRYALITVGDLVQAWSRVAGGAWEPLSAGVTDSTYRSGRLSFYLWRALALDDFGGGAV